METAMAPEEFREEMKRIAAESESTPDLEDSHRAADGLMCRLLCSLGYKEGVEEFENMDKWYA